METISDLIILINLILGVVVFAMYLKVIIFTIKKKLAASSLAYLGALILLFLITYLFKTIGLGGSIFVNPLPFLIVCVVWVVKLFFYRFLKKANFDWRILILIDIYWTIIYLAFGLYSSIAA